MSLDDFGDETSDSASSTSSTDTSLDDSSDSSSTSEQPASIASTDTSYDGDESDNSGSDNDSVSPIDRPSTSSRELITSKAKDTVNKIARRHKCDVNILCRVNHGLADPSGNIIELKPTHHLRRGTELYLPTPSDEETFKSEADTSSSSSSSTDIEESNPPSANTEESKEDRPPTSATAPSEPKESEPAYSCLAMERDLAEETYDLAMAAAHAATPPLQASDATEHRLRDCMNTIREAFHAINTVHDEKSPKRARRRARKIIDTHKRIALIQFIDAYRTEEAHLVESLRHLQARDIPTPKNYNEAIESTFQQYWNEAIAQEIANLKNYGVYRFEDLPPGCRPINSHYIFKIKANSDGLVDRFKARLVADGYRQRFGIEYIKTHASVCKMQTFRAQMAHAAEHDLIHEIIDVKSAYLEADMDPEIPVYINIPGQPAPPGMAARLIKSLYGTKQAGHNWYETIVPLLTNEWGFEQSPADPCCFIHQTRKQARTAKTTSNLASDFCIICLFVDDFSITSTRTSTKSRDHFFEQLNKKYTTSKADDDNVYLGIRCRRLAPHTMFLDQQPYVEDFLHMYGFTNCRSVSTPTSGLPLTKAQQPVESSEKDAMSKHPYREIIGSLRYLEQCTRPDISFALNRLSRYQANPGIPHWQELKHLCKYVHGTKSHGIMYGKGVYPKHRELQHDLSGPLECFVDSDHAADKDTRRSCTGYIFFSRGGPISWRSRLQHSSALSTTEAEFMAASDAGCENIWLRRLLGQFTELATTRINGMLIPKDFDAPKMSQKFFDTEVPTMFNEDNIGCIKCSEDPVLHGRMKHIDIKYHKIKEFVADKSAKLIYIATHRQIADLLTKSLKRPTFVKLRDCMVIDPLAPGIDTYNKSS